MVDTELREREERIHGSYLRPRWTAFTPDNKFIKTLFDKYICLEFLENYYDSEPDYDEAAAIETYGDDYWDDPAWQERWKALLHDYEPIRLTINNWSEPHYAGNWDVTQEEVDEVARVILQECVDEECDDNDKRMYHTHSLANGCYVLYWYGRDLPLKCDYYWTFLEK